MLSMWRSFAISVVAFLVSPAIAAAVHADQTQIANYAKARKLVWAELYPTKLTGTAYSEIYCGFDFRHRNDVEMQVEHAYPANWMATHLGCGTRTNCQRTSQRFNRMEADLRNLWPAAAAANGLRSNHTFAIITGENWEFEDCDIERESRGAEFKPTGKVVEPPTRHLVMCSR